ncbi:alpha/beta hydrolase family esterase [Armatimonas rosea]|uniref:Polyhydroxybutyrate depolymerase n=1 Tax=Armatimonas rosea TaxID=685828 RepID=A0A7W9SQE8_ARMRO|nr:prolyl oligopeptidase family serine peptidase [Armatimonas rosea]MBB6050922.1 polyhydroxybutyrate depolymerase [Armatimonas rosea]
MRERQKEWTIKGVKRTAVVVLPPKTEGAPIVFGFHGHGGNGGYCAQRWNLQALWPEAIFVYPNGLPTKTPRDPDGGKPGWMMFGGGLIANRDLELFDAMLETAKREWRVDEKRLYCTGHSNGGGFTYYLWGQRPELFAALGVVAGAGERLVRSAKPCPLMHIGGKNDPIVTWESQQAAIDAAKRINGERAPVEVVLHDDGHAYPPIAPEKLISFFKKQRRA